MLRTMVTQLITHERIKTTLPKAKELRRLADQMVTLAKRGDLHARRQAAAVIRDDVTLAKLFEHFGPRYQHRQGGYTRILQTGRRYGDMAKMAYIEYVDRPGEMRPARTPWLEGAEKGAAALAAEAEAVQAKLDADAMAAAESDGESGAGEPTATTKSN